MHTSQTNGTFSTKSFVDISMGALPTTLASAIKSIENFLMIEGIFPSFMDSSGTRYLELYDGFDIEKQD